MTERNLPDKLEELAINNVLSLVDVHSLLPNYVFRVRLCSYWFCESDDLFASRFVEITDRLLEAEGSHVIALVNLNNLANGVSPRQASVSITRGIGGREYFSQITQRSSRVEDDWVATMDSYGCASDIGDWVIYADKMAEMAIMGFLTADMEKKAGEVLARLDAKMLPDALAHPVIDAYANMNSEWKERLKISYTIK